MLIPQLIQLRRNESSAFLASLVGLNQLSPIRDAVHWQIDFSVLARMEDTKNPATLGDAKCYSKFFDGKFNEITPR